VIACAYSTWNFTSHAYLPLLFRKTASLGEMIQQLTPLGVRVPGGFGVSSTAYDAVLDRHDLRQRLTSLLEGVDGKYYSKISVWYYNMFMLMNSHPHVSPCSVEQSRTSTTCTSVDLRHDK
jgi:hypothetical protein